MISYHARGSGVIIARSDWTDDAILVKFDALRYLTEGHQLRGAGNLYIFAGGAPLLSWAGEWAHDRSHSEGPAINVPMFGVKRDGLQYWLARGVSGANGVVEGPSETRPGEGVIGQCQYREGYQRFALTCKDAARRVTYYNNMRTIAVYDRTIPYRNGDLVTIPWHVQSKPVIVGNTFEANSNDFGGTWKIKGTVVLPENIGLTAEPQNNGPNGETTSWAVILASTTETFCTIFQICPNDENFPPLTYQIKDGSIQVTEG